MNELTASLIGSVTTLWSPMSVCRSVGLLVGRSVIIALKNTENNTTVYLLSNGFICSFICLSWSKRGLIKFAYLPWVTWAGFAPSAGPLRELVAGLTAAAAVPSSAAVESLPVGNTHLSWKNEKIAFWDPNSCNCMVTFFFQCWWIWGPFWPNISIDWSTNRITLCR